MKYDILKSNYSRENWNILLNDIFGTNFRAVINPDKLQADNKTAKNVFQLGEITLEDGNTLAIYEVALQDNINVNRNRVAIRNLLRTHWNKYDGAFIANYKQTDAEWRFSFVSEIRGWNADHTKYGKIATEPKRFTYLLGENENVKTAVERFEKLNLNSTISEVKEAFSVEKLSDEFFEKYKKCYGNLVEFFTAENYTKKDGKIVLAEISGKTPDASLNWFFKGDKKAARDFCKKTLGQIVFLYFLQKKRWLGNDINFMKNYHNESYESLSNLFFKALNKERHNKEFTLPNGNIVEIPFLNGGLFEDEYSGQQYPDIPKELLSKFFDFLEEYNFTIYENAADNEQTIGIDPEMLSKIFENLLEDNKEKGAYYTPKEIVRYMCEESLIEYLIEKIKREIVENLVKNKECSNIESACICSIEEALEKIKICDPAIGSGAFPMGMLNLIFSIKETLNPNIDRAKTKLDIIQNSIYGVDIEKGAVDIARLRFWLSLIIDEKEPKPLPNLDFKIVQGDSLVSKFEREIITFDWELLNNNKGDSPMYKENRDYKEYADKLKIDFGKLIKKQTDFFRASDKDKKEKIKKEVRDLKIEILESQMKLEQIDYIERNKEQDSFFGHSKKNAMKNLEIQERKNTFKKILNRLAKLKNNEEHLEFFDWKLDFSEIMNPMQMQKKAGLNGTSGGFDVVIGNPPYVFARNSKSKGMTDTDKSYFYENYSLAEYQINLYPLFIEKGTNVLKNNGILCYITPNNWLTLNTNKLLRQFVLKQSNVNIINFYKRIFKDADVDSVIVSYKKNNMNITNEKIKLAEWENEYTLISEIEKENILESKDFVINIEALKENETLDLLRRIESNSVALSKIADVKAGLKAYEKGKGKPSQTENMTKNRIYHSTDQRKSSFRYLEGKNVCRYLLDWSGEYLQYGDNLAAPRTNFDIFSTPRILVRQIPSPLPYCINACYTEEVLLNDLNSMNIIYIKVSPLYLLGVLNSRLISYWFANKFGKLQRGIFPQFKINELAQFPIPSISLEQQQPIIAIVNKILSTKKKNPEADTSELEREIDRYVYELYGLSKEEIKVVEGT